jgi:hypothetical protein
LAVFELLNDRELGPLAQEVVNLQQSLLMPDSKHVKYALAYAAVLRRVNRSAARPGDERYFSADFIAEAEANPVEAFDFLELSRGLHAGTGDLQPQQVEIEQGTAPQQKGAS